MTQIMVKTELDIAKELQEFFLGTYAEQALQDAIDSGNDDLIGVAVREYGSQRQLIEEAENAKDYQVDCF